MNVADAKVIVSNGFSRYHMSPAAAQLYRRGRLALLITGAYPTPRMRLLLRLTRAQKIWPRKIARLLERGEDLPDRLVRALPLSETLNVLNLFLRRLGRASFLQNSFFSLLGMRAYGATAARHVGSQTAGIYHYRGGFGHSSIDVARRNGMVIVCDHAIPHPAVVQHLIDHSGRLPSGAIRTGIDSFRQFLVDDVNRCDYVIAPSEFVKETFVAQGWDPGRIKVVFFGLDDNFLASVPPRPITPSDTAVPTSFLFAGAWMTRKGAERVAQAFTRVGDLPWSLTIAGGVESTVGRIALDFLKHPRVRYPGVVLRAELARLMSESEVFIFPSLSEGSARVITEAMACGCYIITTRNACGIVRDGVNGSLVKPYDSAGLERAIRFAIGNRAVVREIGLRNAEEVRSRYRQVDYGAALDKVYGELLEEAHEPARLARSN